MIRAIFVYLYIGVAVVLILPWLILWTLVTGDRDPLYHTAMKAVRLLLRLVGIRVRTEGLENIPPGVCVFAANHISAIDPLTFIPVIPRRVAILVKKELFRIPILSRAMRLEQFVPVDRGDRESATASVEACVERLKQGLSFAVYPEGTRSPDGRLRPFKKGTFVMAIAAGVPIVPVSIVGAQKLMQKGSWTIRGGKVLVCFGPPVDASEYTPDRRNELLARVESLVAAALPDEQRPLPRSWP
jgi:1-acyl-sn-glycerol-3-phosphate acyltransferase